MQNARRSDTLSGALYAATGFSLFALGDAIFKYLGPFYPVTVIGFYSSLFSLLVLLAAAALRGGVRAALHTRALGLHLLRAVLCLVEFILVLYAFTHMALAKCYTLLFAAPFLTALLGVVLLKERPGWRVWAAIGGGFSGVLVVLRPAEGLSLDAATLAALGAALFFATTNVVVRRIGPEAGSILGFGLYVELVVTPALALLLGYDGFAIPAPAHLGLLLLGSMVGATGLVCVARAFTCAPAAIAAPFHYIQMLWAITLGFAVFGERPDMATAAGAAIIVASGLWLIRVDQGTVEENGSPPPSG